MELHGISADLKNTPILDPDFFPILRYNRSFLATEKKPIGIAVERSGGQIAACHTFIHGTPEMREADQYYIERLVKTILWIKGGVRIYISGDKNIYQYLCEVYQADGKRNFDFNYMADVFEHPFEILFVDKVPDSKNAPQKIGGNLSGCRIGFDAGGSDRKVGVYLGHTLAITAISTAVETYCCSAR